MRRKPVAILVVLFMLLSMVLPSAASAASESDRQTLKKAPAVPRTATEAITSYEPGPRSATVENDVFLHGNYIEVGVSKSGSFGTATLAPEGFHATYEGDYQLGFCVDKDGWDIGEPPTTGDFFLPGTPEEGFTIGYKQPVETGEIPDDDDDDYDDGGPYSTLESPESSESEIEWREYNFTNAERVGDTDLPSTTTDISAGNILAAETEGTTSDEKIGFTQVVSFNANDKFFKNTITLTNQTVSENVYSVRYMRSFDPDQDVELHSEFDTLNAVLSNPPQDDSALVRATGAESGEPVFLIAFDERARAATYGFTNRDAYAADIYDIDGSKLLCDDIRDDAAITMTFDLGTLAPGESVTFEYYTSLNEDFEKGMDEIIHNFDLSGTDVEEHSPNGTDIGTLSVTGTCEEDSHTFTLLDDAGGRFVIEGNKLKVKDGGLLDYYTASSHTITLRLECPAEGVNLEKSFVINVTKLPYFPLRPVLDGITVEDGVYTAHWGWKNENSSEITVPLSDDNKFTGNPISGSLNPMTEFVSGRVYNAFTTVFDGNDLVWTLKGPDDSKRTATASKNSPLFDVTRFGALSPVLEGVTYDVTTSVYMAHWGWKNDSPFDIIVPHSNSRFNRGENIPENNFEPGRHRDIFDTQFDGNNLVWTLRGPDGETRTATASNIKVLTEIKFSQDTYSLLKGNTSNAVVTAFYSDGTTSDITGIARYRIINNEEETAAASIDNNGVLTGIVEGTVTAEAEYLGLKAIANITVTASTSSGGGGGGGSSAPPSGTLVDRNKGSIPLGNAVQINVIKDEIVLNYDQKLLGANSNLTPKIYHWNSAHRNWVALATYPAGDGKVKALNDGKYKGWFRVYGIIQPGFTDVNQHWAEPVVNRMNGLGMIEGYAAGSDDLTRLAKVDQNVTRTEFAVFLYRLLNIDPDKPLLKAVSQDEVSGILEGKFDDADSIPSWARNMVAALTQAGYIEGRNSSFAGDAPITRIEAAVMVSRILKAMPNYKPADLDEFKDAADIPEWAKAAVADDLINGYPDGTLRPNDTISRAEALTVLQKLFVNGMGW